MTNLLSTLTARRDESVGVRAVQFDRHGGVDVLRVREVEDPAAAEGCVLVAVRAAGINPGEIAIREGCLSARWRDRMQAERNRPMLPSGQGIDFAGIVLAVDDGVTAFSPGDEVLGWCEARAGQAELVAVPAEHLVPKPAGVPWEVAGSLFVAGTAAYACIRAVEPQLGETVVVSAAAGGVGSITVQLARRTGATVIGLAGERHHDWLRAHEIVPVTYGEGQKDRILEAAGGAVHALIDTFGGGYVDLAIELGIAPQRINTIIDDDAVVRLGVKNDGSRAVKSAAVLAELAALVADGSLEIPIARVYRLDEVRDAVRELAERHTLGKIVLVP
jgi:NADPH:quinone reductase-like Zn-dependent oxidoreductase